MAKVKAEAKWVENVHSVIGNTRAYSASCDLSVATEGKHRPSPMKRDNRCT